MTTELIILACSVLHGAQCREVALTYSDVSVLTCTMAGMPEVAKWAEVHPNWSVRRWACRPAGLFAKA